MRDDALSLQSARVIKCRSLRVTAAMVSALEKEVKYSPLGPGGRRECARAELGARSVSAGRGDSDGGSGGVVRHGHGIMRWHRCGNNSGGGGNMARSGGSDGPRRVVESDERLLC